MICVSSRIKKKGTSQEAHYSIFDCSVKLVLPREDIPEDKCCVCFSLLMLPLQILEYLQQMWEHHR